MLIDIPQCIGCGSCVRACAEENDVPDGYYRTWVEPYHVDIVFKSKTTTGFPRLIYRALTLGSDNINERSLHIDERLGYFITVIGIPSAFLLHGYVGFIFGSIKSNPWWSSPLMPIVFIFSAMVSGIAAVMLLYLVTTRLRGREIDIRCLDKIAQYLFYIFMIDFSLEMLDLVHTRLWTSQVIMPHPSLYHPVGLGKTPAALAGRGPRSRSRCNRAAEPANPSPPGLMRSRKWRT